MSAGRELEKTQFIRLLDVAILGPFMIHVAMNKKPPQALRTGLLLAGIATILYNGSNFLNDRARTTNV